MMIKNMAGIYLFYENQVLMIKRTKKDFGGEGEYYSIGGKFESDELNNPTKCILRELEEETGIKEEDITNLELKYIVFRNHKDVITQNHLFFAKLSELPNLKECDEGVLEWVYIEDIFNKPMPASSRACLEHYFSVGKNNSAVTIAAATNRDGYGEYEFTELWPFEVLYQTKINNK